MLNAIVGSLIMTVLAVLIGTPLGILAGTYMAEYGRYSKLTLVVRFINDILLSAPSIVIGLFIYEVMVRAAWATSPAWPAPGAGGDRRAGRGAHDRRHAAARARPAARGRAALGMPRSLVIRRIAYRAARAGMITGVLLAVARISGETAPLLFTALNNQFWSTDLDAPMASLPAVIFQFALSPYEDWQQLAWTGALIITFAVLALSILARAFDRTRDPK